MLNAYHSIPIFIIPASYWYCHTRAHVCVYHNSFNFFPLVGLFICLLVFLVPCSYKLLSHQQGSFLCLWYFPLVWHDFQLACPCWELEMKIESTLLAATIRKSRCGAQNMSYVLLHSATFGAQIA
jgi:hypothetical protein